MGDTMPESEYFSSDSKDACPDFCIQDAGANCKLCGRWENTWHYKKSLKVEPTIQDISKDLNSIVVSLSEKSVIPSPRFDNGDLFLRFWGWELALLKNGRWYLSDTSGG